MSANGFVNRFIIRTARFDANSAYYELNRPENKLADDPHKDDIIRVFKVNRKVYGTRRIKEALRDENIILSRCLIGCIMAENGLVSTYTVAHYKPHKTKSTKRKLITS